MIRETRFPDDNHTDLDLDVSDAHSLPGKRTIIGAEEAGTPLESDESVVLLDVRTTEECEAEHILGERLIFLDGLSDQVEEAIPDMEAGVLAYC